MSSPKAATGHVGSEQMRQKIEWFQEVLSLEPGSKVFFALGKLFVELGELPNAVSTLRQGLDRHPDFMEARLLLVQLLARLDRLDEAFDELNPIIDPLKAYPDFWSVWAKAVSGDRREFSVFLMIVASHLAGAPIRWTDVVLDGLNTMADRLVGPGRPLTAEARPVPLAAPTVTLPPREVAPAAEAASLRTKTMAELLAQQGDYQGAFDIYRELWLQTGPGPEKVELGERLEKMKAGLSEVQKAAAAKEDPFTLHAKNRLLSTLEVLAARFEARARA